MAETISIGGRDEYDWDGNLIPGSGARSVSDCVVSPAGESRIDQADFDGNTRTLSVLAPPGTSVAEGDSVTIRGLVYTVKFAPFDWSVGRRPVHRRHRPRVAFTVERGEG